MTAVPLAVHICFAETGLRVLRDKRAAQRHLGSESALALVPALPLTARGLWAAVTPQSHSSPGKMAAMVTPSSTVVDAVAFDPESLFETEEVDPQG